MAVYTGHFLVWKDDDEWECSLSGRQRKGNRPVVGDRVVFNPQADGTGTILSILPRNTTLVRKTANRGKRGAGVTAQILAANVEQLVIVAALHEPPFREGLVERFLVAGAMAGLTPLICITKLDLDQGQDFSQMEDKYQQLKIPILGTSIHRSETLIPLGKALAGRTSVLAGHSGVGKTSLLNILAKQDMAVGEMGEGQVSRGRHTTTTARLIHLEEGGYVIDSPGIREFGLHGLKPEELARHFTDFRPYLDQCGFRDCLHHGEPKCVVKGAVEEGKINASRYQSYQNLLEELGEE